MMEALLGGFTVAMVCSGAVVGIFGGMKVVQWLGKKLDVEPWDIP
jgi:hypothetical protein